MATNHANHYSKSVLMGIIVLFHLLLLTVPLFFRFNTEELFEFNKLMLTYGLTIFIVGLWLIRMVTEHKLIFRRTIFDIPIALFLISQILSTVFSIHPYTSWFGYYTRFHGGLLSTFTYVALYYAFVSNLSTKHIRPLILTAGISATLVGVYAILEHFGNSFSCLLVSQGTTFGTECWVQDVQNRVFATFGQPNWLAAYLITLLPVSFVLAVQAFQKSASRQKKRWFFFISSLIFFVALLYTKSRSGLLGLAVSATTLTAGLTLLELQRRRWQELPTLSLPNVPPTIDRRWLVSLVGLLMLMALVIGTPYTPSLNKLWQKPAILMNEVKTQDADTSADKVVGAGEEVIAGEVTSEEVAINRLEEGGTDSGEIRKIVWEGAIRVWQRYPLVGSGVETFAYSYYRDRPAEHNLVSEWDFLYNKAHNEFLNYLATTGLLGLLSYSLLLGWFFWIAAAYVLKPLPKLGKLDQAKMMRLFANRGLVVGLTSGVVGLSVSNFFGFSTVMVSILLYLFIAFVALLWLESQQSTPNNPSLAQTKTKAGDDRSRRREPLGLADFFFIIVILLGTIFGLSRLYSTWKADTLFAQGKALVRAGHWQAGVNYLESAALRSPQEATYYEELALQYAQLAVALAEAEEPELSEYLADNAVRMSATALALNPVHLNFYKSQARVFLRLSILDDEHLVSARDALVSATELAPTDAKILYNLALIELGLGNADEGLEYLEKAVDLKPNYQAARFELGKLHEALGNFDEARHEYEYILTNLNPLNEPVREQLEQLEEPNGTIRL
jgi:putative inorganic carbon (hco3(-)) transporter